MQYEELCKDVPEFVMKEVRQSPGVVDGRKEGSSYSLHSAPEDDHQEGRTRSEMGPIVHEESASEPKVQGFVGPIETRSDSGWSDWDAPRAISIDASPWMVGGDFNTVLSLEERSGSAAPSSFPISNFHDTITDCALLNAGYTRSPYT
ncbi:UNVERIFIED_CONTAM: hypothetical protein Sradi_5226700 [Sesamum radiatum]|uniref:Uncharacterized protein n=1 Tax=Sesamum radiatum TaxID=300843 RepID=A0AAW2LK52_SESRA